MDMPVCMIVTIIFRTLSILEMDFSLHVVNEHLHVLARDSITDGDSVCSLDT